MLFKSKCDASDRKPQTRGSQQEQKVFLSCSCKQSAALSSSELCVMGKQAPPCECCSSSEHMLWGGETVVAIKAAFFFQSDKIHMYAQTVTSMYALKTNKMENLRVCVNRKQLSREKKAF